MSQDNKFGRRRPIDELASDEDASMREANKSSPPPDQDVDMDEINSDKFSEGEAMEERDVLNEEGKAESEGSGEDL